MVSFVADLFTLAKQHMDFLEGLEDAQQKLALDIMNASFLGTVLQPSVVLLFQILKKAGQLNTDV